MDVDDSTQPSRQSLEDKRLIDTAVSLFFGRARLDIKDRTLPVLLAPWKQ
jgi:hypothetical protein